jgi:hypothetical protein
MKLTQTDSSSTIYIAVPKPTIVIELEDYDYTGSSNDIYGTITTVNGIELFSHNSDRETIIKQILEYIGYDVEIINKYYYE